MTNLVDAVGQTKYGYTAGGQLCTEDGPFVNDTVTNTYNNRLRVALALQQPSGMWTNGFGYDTAKHLTSVTSSAGVFNYTLAATAPASALIKKLAFPADWPSLPPGAQGPTLPPPGWPAPGIQPYPQTPQVPVQPTGPTSPPGDIPTFFPKREHL